jgi:hypothetical protein
MARIFRWRTKRDPQGRIESVGARASAAMHYARCKKKPRIFSQLLITAEPLRLAFIKRNGLGWCDKSIMLITAES